MYMMYIRTICVLCSFPPGFCVVISYYGNYYGDLYVFLYVYIFAM